MENPPSESEFLNWIRANDIKPVFKGPRSRSC